MIFYTVDASDGDRPITFETAQAARSHAHTMANDVTPPGEYAIVEEIRTVPLTKAVICRLINGEGGFVAEQRVITKVLSRREHP